MDSDAAKPPPTSEARLRARCARLEEKIDGLVRESVRREGEARLLVDLLDELDVAGDLREVAGRSLARLVTSLRLDMAFIALIGEGWRREDRLFSLGCPRQLLEQLTEIPWQRVANALQPEPPLSALVDLLEKARQDTLVRAMRIDGVRAVSVTPLATQGRMVGLLGLGGETRPLFSKELELYLPAAARLLALLIDNARLRAEATSATALTTGVLENLTCSVVVCDATGVILSACDARQNLFRGRATAGTNLRGLLSPPEGTQTLLRQVGVVARGGDAIRIRALRQRLPAGERLLNAYVAPLGRGQVVVSFEDITQRESMESDLRRARALASTMFAAAPAGVLYLQRSGEIVDANGAAATMLERKRSELLGARLDTLYPELWQTVVAQGDDAKGEITLARDLGPPLTVAFAATRLGRPGRPAGILLQILDLGELQSLREQIRRRDNLALMGQMVSFIAHEIKNPLFGISSAAQVLAREDGSPEASRLTNAMLSEVDRLSTLLEDLLVFGTRRTIEPVPCDLRTLCREIVDLQASAASQRNLSIEEAFEDRAEEIFCDPARIKQVVTNLLTNALEASPPGESVIIGGGQEGEHYAIWVHNRGEFIPPENHEAVFDLFYSTKPRGSGLGLPICRKIVDAHRGELTIDSSPEKGTRVTVRLPMGRG